MSHVFLGGTCNGSDWRDRLIKMLRVSYFNPVVPDWNEAAYQKELQERESSTYCLYVLTPLMTGVYAVAEVVDDSNKRPNRTVLCILTVDRGASEMFNTAQTKSMEALKKMVRKNGAHVFDNLKDVATFLNATA